MVKSNAFCIFNLYINFGPKTKKYQDHIVCSYGYKLICVDERYNKPYKTYFGEDAFDKFINYMIKARKYCSKIIETELNDPQLWLKMMKKI